MCNDNVCVVIMRKEIKNLVVENQESRFQYQILKTKNYHFVSSEIKAALKK